MLEEIPIKTKDPVIDIALDTIRKNKQMILFVNTKRSAESAAEKITSELSNILNSVELQKISEKTLNILSTPTKQCKRLSACILHGVAFHHSGLHPKQRELVEENFRKGILKVICATPTLAAGVDLPAFRVVIRDLKRYGGLRGMTDIPVLEYEQQAGRAGRPKYDSVGEAICISSSVTEKEKIWHQYIKGEPENIISKLAVEPVLRTYTLSLVATGIVRTDKTLKEFLSKTFYAHQYTDLTKLNNVINKMLLKLEEWGFIIMENKSTSFMLASKVKKEECISTTPTGKRVAELYLDPYTAHFLLVSMQKMQKGANKKSLSEFSVLHMISSTLEIRPLFNTRKKDLERVEEYLNKHQEDILVEKPDIYSEDYYEFLNTINTASVFDAWINETKEDVLLENFNVTPGELNAKLDKANWLIHSAYELSKLQNFKEISKFLLKIRLRLMHGVKEELLPLLKLKGIGRVRARKLFRNGIKDLGAIKKADVSILSQLLGKNVALDIKKQVGQDLREEKIQVKPNKRKGQISLNDFKNVNSLNNKN